MDIRGKHALITGGSRGIGATIAGELARRGARCTLVARDSETLHATAAAGSSLLPCGTGAGPAGTRLAKVGYGRRKRRAGVGGEPGVRDDRCDGRT